MNIFVIILIVGLLFAFLSVTFTLAACMLSSRISQAEEFNEILVDAADHQMISALAAEDQIK